MTVIRPATLKDIDGIVDCVRMFFIEHDLASLGMRLDEDYYRAWLTTCIPKPHILIFVADHEGEIVGGIAGMLGPTALDPSVSLLELAWFVKPEHRGIGFDLLSEFEAAGKTYGARQICMTVIANGMQEGLHAVYEQLGYTKLETQYRKDIGG
jgi:GNAT superfamily N-acetyltransferase